jgi:ABC-2 type transport system permease protein
MTGFGQIFLREWRALRQEARLAALAVAGPLAFALVLGAAYSPKKVTGLKTTIVDQDSSALSRELTRAVLATQPFVLGQYADSSEEFRHLAAEGRSQICFVFPRHMERDIKAGRGARVAVLVDTSNLLGGNAAATMATTVLSTYSVGVDIQTLTRRGVGPATRAVKVAMPIAQETRIVFNPAFDSNYANFMVPGMLAIPIQFAAMAAVARAGARESGPAAAGLLSISRNPFVMAAAKCAAYVAFLWPVCWLTLQLPRWQLGAPMKGSEWLLGAVVLWFVTNMVLVGFAISCFVKEAVFATEICTAITMPNFLISGFTWPAFSMPWIFEAAAYALPMRPFALAIRKITLMGAGIADLSAELLWLTAWSVVAGSLALAGARLLRRTAAPERTHA